MKKEWKSILQSTWIKVVLIAITIIPMVYAGVFLGSMWDPYGNADQMPVAVVDKDKEVEYNGSKLHVGKALCENLKDNRSMDFQFVKEGVAKKGLEDGTYYMVITIPEKFSYNATTLLNQDPEKMVLEYATNPGTNYIASKMDETAIRTIQENISKTITKTYADTLFSQVKTLSNGLREASNGSVKLEEGVTQTIAGNDTIKENLRTLASSTLQFEDGSKTLMDGVETYTKGVEQLSDGSKQLDEGLQTLKGNSVPLSQGVTKLNDGSSSLRKGVDTYTTGVDALTLGLHQVTSNSTALNNGVNEVSKAISQSKVGSEQLLNGMQS
ncbi:MAG: YhgE/Pip family protein, partial [Longicatena sp.]